MCPGREGREAGGGGGGGASLSNEMEAELACTLYASARPHPRCNSYTVSDPWAPVDILCTLYASARPHPAASVM